MLGEGSSDAYVFECRAARPRGHPPRRSRVDLRSESTAAFRPFLCADATKRRESPWYSHGVRPAPETEPRDMPEANELKSSAPAPTLSPMPVLRLAVFHRSADVTWHTAPLSQVEGLELIVAWQGTSWILPRGVSGLLWEFAPQDATDPRLAALIDRIPAASYSASQAPGLAELSKTFGFRHHLTTPLRLIDVERALGLPAVVDLADRLETATPRLVEFSHRPEVISEVLRAVNAAGDPVGVSAALTQRVSEWLPMTSWTVLAVEPDGLVRRLDTRDLDDAFRSAADSIAQLVVQSGKAAMRSTSYVSDRVSSATQPISSVEASVMGWPLVASGETVGVLVGIDHGRPRRMPVLSPELAEALSRLVEPGAYALPARAARRARRGAVGHRRPHAALQFPVPQRGAAQGNQALGPQRLAALAAVHRSGRLQADQRRARPPARQPGAHRGGLHHHARVRERPTSSRVSVATSSRSCCPKPAPRARSRSPVACATGSRGTCFSPATARATALTASIGVATLPDVGGNR